MRAFCCAALLHAAGDPANRDQGFAGNQNDTLAPLIESALALGHDLPAAAARYITWHLPSLKASDDNRPFYAFGLLVLAVLGTPDAFSLEDVEALAAFVDRAEMQVRDSAGVCTPDMFNGSFLELTRYDGNHHVWRALARGRASPPQGPAADRPDASCRPAAQGPWLRLAPAALWETSVYRSPQRPWRVLRRPARPSAARGGSRALNPSPRCRESRHAVRNR